MRKRQVMRALRTKERRQKAARLQRGGTKLARKFREARERTGKDYSALVEHSYCGRRSQRK